MQTSPSPAHANAAVLIQPAFGGLDSPWLPIVSHRRTVVWHSAKIESLASPERARPGWVVQCHGSLATSVTTSVLAEVPSNAGRLVLRTKGTRKT